MVRRPIRVLMTADAVGGIWTYAADLASGFVARGIAVTVAVVGPGLDEARRRGLEAFGITVVDLGHPPEWLADGPAAVGRGGAALAALARETEADIVHLNHPALGAGSHFGCPTLAVCHSCVATWWSTVRGTPLPFDLAWQADLVGAGYRSATALAAPSRAFARTTQETYGLGAAPEVISNGRAAPPMPHASFAVPGGLTVGRLWDEGKDIATLDRAAGLTRVPIRAVGPTTGPNGASVVLHHLDAVGAAGQARIRALMTERPVFLSAARYEPFGLSVLEAAQAGCALVLSDIATFRELWGDAALFVPPGDAAGFAAALDRLVAEPSLRTRLGAAALDRAAQFTLAGAVDHLVEHYAVLLGRAVPGLWSRTGDPASEGVEAA